MSEPVSGCLTLIETLTLYQAAKERIIKEREAREAEADLTRTLTLTLRP